MFERYSKTELGRREIRDRAHNLSRTARTLLLILDGSRSGDEWVSMVSGAGQSDLQALLGAGLVAIAGAGAAPAPASVPAPAAAPAAVNVNPATGTSLDYDALYGSLNAIVKDQLGLIKGYRYSLQVERASGVQELVDVAVRVVEEVRKAHGDNMAQMVRRALGLNT